MKLLRSRWQSAVLICGKCSKKVDGGFGRKGKTPLAKALRAELGVGKGRRATLGVVETRCLGVCPKNAVTVLAAGRPDEWLLIKPGTPIAEVAEALALDRANTVTPDLIGNDILDKASGGT